MTSVTTIFGFTTAPLNPAVYPNYTTVVDQPTTRQVNANQSVAASTNTRGGRIVPDGWLVTPHAATA